MEGLGSDPSGVRLSRIGDAMKGGKHGWILRYCFCCLLVSGACGGADHSLDVYSISVIAASTGVGLDAASSWGHYEAQPLYRSSNGRFQTRGAVLRVGMLGVALIAQKIARKKAPQNKFVRRILTVVNFGVCGSGTSIAIHNWR